MGRDPTTLNQVRAWVEVLAGSVFIDPANDQLSAIRTQSMQALHGFFIPHIQAKVDKDIAGEDAGRDLLGLLAKGRVDGERISMAEMLSFAQFLLVAGSATTTNLIGNFVKLMMQFPEQFAKLKANPRLLDNAIEEVLRYDAPVHGLFRTNNEDPQLGELDVPKD